MAFRVEIILKDLSTLTISKGLKSFSCSENLKGADMDLKPGYIEQNAEVTFYDYDDSFRNKIKVNSINFFKGRQLRIYADNTLLGIYIVDRIDASVEDVKVVIYCIDYSFSFEDVLVSRTGLMAAATVKSLLDHVFESSLHGESYAAVDVDTYDLINDTRIFNTYILEKTVKEALNNICSVGAINMFYDKGIFKVARCF